MSALSYLGMAHRDGTIFLGSWHVTHNSLNQLFVVEQYGPASLAPETRFGPLCCPIFAAALIEERKQYFTKMLEAMRRAQNARLARYGTFGP